MKLVLDFLIFISARDAKGILVKIVNLTCPGCGARLEVDMDRKMAFCSYCGAVLPVDDEIQKVQLDGAEKAGYEFEKGRQRAKRKRRRRLFRLSKPAINQPPSQLSSPKSLPPTPAGPSRAPEEAQNVAVGSGVDLHFPRSAHDYHAEQGRHEQKG